MGGADAGRVGRGAPSWPVIEKRLTFQNGVKRGDVKKKVTLLTVGVGNLTLKDISVIKVPLLSPQKVALKDKTSDSIGQKLILKEIHLL